MTHVLIVYETIEPCNIETIRVFKLLEEKDLLLCQGILASHVKTDDLVWSDVLVFVRSTSAIERDISLLAKKMGKFVILSLDDDFLSLGNSYGADGSGYRSARHRCLRSILKSIDCLVTVNELLARKYIEYCTTNRYVITHTVVEKEDFFSTAQNGKSKDRIKLAVYVNDGTQGIFNQILRPALRLLSDNYKNRISLYLMALKPDMSEFESSFDITFVPHLPYKEFKKFLGAEGFDIGLAPLVDEGFSKYKYFNKFIEYTLAGIPAIYSDCPLYRLVIKDHFNGILTKNSAEDWYEAISMMIDDAILRKSIIENAQKYLYDNFESFRVLDKFVANIPELTGYKTMEAPIGALRSRLYIIKLKYYIFRVHGWLGTGLTLLRRGNVRAIKERLKDR